MLVRIVIENIFSFYERQEFNMLPNPKRERFSHHIYKNLPIPLLKQAAIYGANGAGKSNLLMAVGFIQHFVCEKDFLNKSYLNNRRFKLAPNNDKPINIELEFIEGQTCYYYQVSFGKDDSINESLYISGCGEEPDRLLFERFSESHNKQSFKARDKSGKKLNNGTVDEIVSNYFTKNHYTSTFAMLNELGIIKDENIDQAFQWFKEKLLALGSNPMPKGLASRLEENTELAEFTNRILSNLGIGVKEIRIKKIPLNEFLSDAANVPIERRQEFIQILTKNLSESDSIDWDDWEIVKEDNEFFVKTFDFVQNGINGYEGTLDIERQSEGTKQLLHLIPLLYSVIHKEVVIFVDEIENSTHPINIQAFIKTFSNNKKTKGQLIFTTHECCLLNQQEIMRPDEVWFAEKVDGSTRLYTLNDFKEHNTIDIEKGYLAGRYGAIPYVGLDALLDPEN